MSSRSLTDELESVLRAHSLDAPEPSRAVERILAGTVATTGSHARGTGVGAPSRRPHSLWRMRGWRPPSALIGAVAGVLLVLLAVAVVNSQRGRDRTSSSAASQPAARSAVGGSAAGGAASAAPPGVVAPYAANGTGNPGPVLQPPTDLRCPPMTMRTVGVTAQFQVPAPERTVFAYEFRCSDPSGVVRSGSELQVYERGAHTPVRTLISAAQGLHIDFLTALPEGLRVQFANGAPTGQCATQTSCAVPVPFYGAVGAVGAVTFTTTDGLTFTATNLEPIALACTPAQLAVSVGHTAPGSAVIAMTNKGFEPCALAGYPAVTPKDGPQAGTTALRTLHGTSLGVFGAGAVPPIIVLSPDGTASAAVEPLSGQSASRCLDTHDVAVSLPDTGAIGTFSLPFAGCQLQVHPVVPGGSGTN